jgi:hypothetical protein
MRLEQRVSFADDGCWRWTGHVQTNGYGQMQVDHRMIVVHKLAWLLFRGPVPEGMDVHHACGNKRCVNPDHLELVPHAEHKTRHHRRTHCKRGHPLTPASTYRGRCRVCSDASKRRYERRRPLVAD